MTSAGDACLADADGRVILLPHERYSPGEFEQLKER